MDGFFQDVERFFFFFYTDRLKLAANGKNRGIYSFVSTFLLISRKVNNFVFAKMHMFFRLSTRIEPGAVSTTTVLSLYGRGAERTENWSRWNWVQIRTSITAQ